MVLLPNAIRTKDRSGRTFLSHVAENGHEKVMKLLLKVTVDVDFKMNMVGCSCHGSLGMGHDRASIDVDSKSGNNGASLSYAA